MRLPTRLPTSGEGVANPSYSYKPSLMGAACRFELTGEGLVFRVPGRSGVWPYATIATIRLSYRPVSMQAQRFRADIADATGRSLPIVSVSWQSPARVAAQDEPYRSFMTQLHQRIAQGDGTPELRAGLSRPLYGFGLVMMALVLLALLGLFIRAAMVEAYGGMLFLVGFAALFGWQIGGFMRRNRPRSYTIDAIPADLLP